MPRYVALLRGVSPMNAKMPELKACFEDMGFANVRTLLSSGNVVFDGPRKKEATLVRALEAGMAERLPRSFPVILRTVDHLQAVLEADPYAGFDLSPDDKRVVTFLREPCTDPPALPIVREGARILAVDGREVFSVYIPNRSDPGFMVVIEKTFGKQVTTRTWDTVRKCAAA